MKLVVVLLFSSLALAQQSTTTSAPCSPIAPDNKGTITINCPGIPKEQGQKTIDLLNRILAKGADTDALLVALNEKVDELLHAVNPNLPTKVYFCNGGWRSEGPGPNVANRVIANFEVDPSLDKMTTLVNSAQYSELLRVCTAQLESKPEWLTPRVFCALADEGLGNETQAKEMLDAYDGLKGPAYDEDAFCKQISDLAHSRLK